MKTNTKKSKNKKAGRWEMAIRMKEMELKALSVSVWIP
jgi:hypothetical protein